VQLRGGMLNLVTVLVDTGRRAIAQRGKRLEYFTIAWNSLEALVAIIAGAIAGSISLLGFGIDSFIEVTSGTTLLWRVSVDADVQKRASIYRQFCWLGFVPNAAFGWWWADPVAGLIMSPITAKEGIEGMKGYHCCDTRFAP
jgi:divalent metal cation (Fe/Co/Zn/Cd) transporter